MKTLTCVAIGDGSAFGVEIDEKQQVWKLKNMIKKKNGYSFPAKDMTLYLSKKGDAKGTDWLKTDDPDVKQLKNGHVSNEIKSLMSESGEMDPADDIKEFDFPDEGKAGRRELHILVELPLQQARESSVLDRETVLRECKELSNRQREHQMRVDAIISSLVHKSSDSVTPSVLGQQEIQRLEAIPGLITHFAPIENEEAFWSAEDQIHANNINVEATLTTFMTPFFNEMVAPLGLVFVNCEQYEWLPQSLLVSTNTELKPDGFATHRGMFRAKGNNIQRPAEGFRFGVPERKLFDCGILFECKLNITPDSFGQVVRYLQHLGVKAAATVLFDRTSFWLVYSHKGLVVRVKKAKWVDSGSKSLLRKFFTANMSQWVTHLANACSSLGVDVVEGEAFLGSGADGRVFKVIDQKGEVFALKIVVNDSINRLYREETALTNAQGTGLTIRLVGSVTEIPNKAAALLLYPVGKPLPRPTSRQEIENIFGLLWKLHLNGLVHGDPRMPNVILDDEQNALWIDLVEVMEASPLLKQFDAEFLTRSILNVNPTVLLDTELRMLIYNYGNSTTADNLNHLVNEVCQTFSRRFGFTK